MPAVLYEKNGRVCIITLNRPEVSNALNGEAWKLLVEAWLNFKNDPEVWAAIVTGAGDNAFCAGQDLKEIGQLRMEAEKAKRPFKTSMPNKTPMRGIELFKPTIAAINGIAIGGGLELALACDIRIAAEHARLGLREVSVSLIPGAGGTQRLPRYIPYGIAMEMILTGDLISAQEAYRVGLVGRVVPLSELIPAAQKIANRINENGPLAVRAAKEAVQRGLQMPLDHALRLERLFISELRESEDAWEGPRAFAEKRKPIYKGK
jgi:E-phenylitaconyl-CoA hydratase